MTDKWTDRKEKISLISYRVAAKEIINYKINLAKFLLTCRSISKLDVLFQITFRCRVITFNLILP